MSAVQQESTAFDLQKEAFAGKMLGILNGGTLSLMTSIGHRTGLFDTMAKLPPSTSVEIASAAGLDERYVREWLGAMLTGGVVELEPETATYSLPAAHAAWLTRAASPNNLAMTAQFVAILGSVEDGIVDCFRNGGGLPYTAFPRFHEVMADESSQTVVSALLDSIVPLVPGLADALGSGIDVLDVGCGSGRALIALAQAFPKSRFSGYDISEEAIASARTAASNLGLTNVEFSVADVAALAAREQFDLVTAFDAIHDQAKPAAVLEGIANALRPGGTFLMQDIAGSSHAHKNLDHPIAPWLYSISCMHCMTVSLAVGGDGLGAMWGEEKAREMLDHAGFERVEVRRLPHDIINFYYVAAKQ
jgi:2-polyprenyl-3-methyl-5-hydroxy-6-metoxy-1,4-benzoquinol methylase